MVLAGPHPAIDSNDPGAAGFSGSLIVALFYLGLRDLSPKQALGRGWCFGFGLFGAGTSWIYYSIHHFGGASVLLAGSWLAWMKSSL